MASGTFLLSKKNSSSSVTFQGKLEWTSTSNGSVANSSNVVVKLYARKQGSSTPTSGKGWNGYITIDGTKTTYSTSSSLSIQNSWVLVSQASKTVAHNNNGTKSITIAGAVTGPSGTTLGSITSSGSTTITLDTIPRYATSVQSLASKTETSISINWSSDNTIDYIWYSSNNGSSWTGLNVTDGKSGSYTISGLSANTTYQVKTRVRRKDNQLTTDSSALSVTTYAYPYANSMPNFTIGNTLTIGLYNPLGRSVEVIIIGADDTLCSYDVTTGTSITGYSGSSVVSSLYSTIPNAKSGTYKVSVAYGSQTSIKTGGTYTINTSACTPTIDSVSYKDTNASVTAITQNNQNIVRNQSIVQYNATGLHPKNSATISSCSVSVNGNTYNLSVSYSGGYIASGGNATIDSSDDVTATFTLTDSRGLTATKTINISMLDWVLPNAIITLQRQNNFYSETDINVDANYSSVDGKNEITLKVRYKKTTDTTYSSYVTLQDNVTSVLNLDNLYEWDVQVLVQDLLGQTTYNLTLDRGIPIIYFDRLKRSMGINCFPEYSTSLELNGNPVGASNNTYNASATDTYSCNYINGLNTYSTSEQRIGTWINGKPIYRKVFTFTTPSGNVDYIINTGVSMDTIIKVYGGIAGASGGVTPIPAAFDFSGTIYTTSFRVSNSNIYYRGHSAYGSTSAFAIIEYTKTTD